jgi:hypothetical protein
MLLYGLIPLAFLLKEQNTSDINMSDIYRYSGRVLLGYASFAVFTNMDVILVKHFFPPAEAGYYSAAATFGKIVLFLPGAIAVVMFPKSSHLYALGRNAVTILKKSLFCVISLCAPVVLTYFLAPDFLVKLLFGESYSATVPLVGPLGLAMGIYALCNVLLLYYLSIHSVAFPRVIAACAFVQVGSLAIFHQTLMQVIIVMIINGLFLLAMSELFCRGLTSRSTLSTSFASEASSLKARISQLRENILHKVSVIMPAHNESDHSAEVIAETSRVLEATDYEIIVVDDGSLDSTHVEASNAASRNTNVKVVGS